MTHLYFLQSHRLPFYGNSQGAFFLHLPLIRLLISFTTLLHVPLSLWGFYQCLALKSMQHIYFASKKYYKVSLCQAPFSVLVNRTWQGEPFPAPRSQRQADIRELEANLVYTWVSEQSRLYKETLSQHPLHTHIQKPTQKHKQSPPIMLMIFWVRNFDSAHSW